MSTYQLDPEKFPRVRRNIILMYLALALVGLGVIYLTVGEALFGQAWTLIPFVGLVFAAAGWYALRQRRQYWQAYQLLVRDRTLIRRAHNVPELRIQRSHITGVREVRNGLILSTPKNENLLLIPRDLPEDDYQEIKRRMERWAGQGA